MKIKVAAVTVAWVKMMNELNDILLQHARPNNKGQEIWYFMQWSSVKKRDSQPHTPAAKSSDGLSYSGAGLCIYNLLSEPLP